MAAVLSDIPDWPQAGSHWPGLISDTVSSDAAQGGVWVSTLASWDRLAPAHWPRDHCLTSAQLPASFKTLQSASSLPERPRSEAGAGREPEAA